MNVWQELNEIENRASRHKRNCSLKKYLLMDLEFIEERTKKIREEFKEMYEEKECVLSVKDRDAMEGEE